MNRFKFKENVLWDGNPCRFIRMDGKYAIVKVLEGCTINFEWGSANFYEGDVAAVPPSRLKKA